MIESAEDLLLQVAGGLRFVLEALSVATVLLGLLACVSQQFSQRPGRRGQRRSLAAARICFGSWLSMALEFQLGADIVATTTTPSGPNLVQLAVVAVIRTFLNVFLARELEAETRLERQSASGQGSGESAA
ncbi:DUF1622 domain-containing protein [Synechococcus sp. CS-1325]|uniref:DUF1622 domain-containing protein n=1 Tax=unclassified Synechococcus TaxID=2626047 RepID=UPI000DB0571E|nr:MULTISPECIES: DUF1622 domain-containing protein [unclassified Synechococcus]MCT0199657.1 DUF1622 domain-containing protein [Synechococcus sp. CS-1325]MCT0231581.1 DUF1622 domain-containing protein [Synechococcus sp. CS-1324]PZV00300.1 MAG: hypothetical protein DCF24_07355 [Cyanobium sp.]PZV02239.1 MAG: hypothetical protein DCF23_11935 [Cyanobium sp.]